jgi:hypothetical protein
VQSVCTFLYSRLVLTVFLVQACSSLHQRPHLETRTPFVSLFMSVLRAFWGWWDRWCHPRAADLCTQYCPVILYCTCGSAMYRRTAHAVLCAAVWPPFEAFFRLRCCTAGVVLRWLACVTWCR